MPKGCAAGNTGVFVNGRELNQGDLDKLSGRGLSVTKHKSYIIKISGKVLDAESREVLYNLGKLAPTYVSVFPKTFSVLNLLHFKLLSCLYKNYIILCFLNKEIMLVILVLVKRNCESVIFADILLLQRNRVA